MVLHKISAAPAPDHELHSFWHSPIPYLFGGLAAMLILIAIALLVLAYTYWKLSGQLEGGDLESTGQAKTVVQTCGPNGFEEQKILVIMAGENNPTFLATPVTNVAVSFT